MKANIGDIVKIITMEGEPHYDGRVAVVRLIDDIGQLHGSWGGLAINPKVDTIEIITE